MIEYLVAHNPDDRVLSKAVELLQQGQLICFPTDTSWIIGCDPFNKKAVDKLYSLKKEQHSKHFSLLCPNISMASEVAEINNSTFRKIKAFIPGHFTFIFNARLKISKALKASKADKQVGLRFPPNTFVQGLLSRYNGLIISTDVNHKMLDLNDEQIEIYSYLIDDSISHLVPLTLDPQEYDFDGQSTIIDFADNEPIVLRQGRGQFK